MSEVNVLIVRKIDDEYKLKISAVSPDIRLMDASGFAEAEDKGDFSSSAKFDELLAKTEVIYGFAPPRNVIARAPRLKYIHTMLAGVERIMTDDLLRSPVIITNARGVHDTPCSEVVLEMMLMLAKNAPIYFIHKQNKTWQRLPPSILRSKTVGIVGLGSIGVEIARLSKAFRMKVIGVRRSAKHITKSRYADAIYPPAQLHEMLSQCDFVVMTLPYTPETDKLIGENELRVMKPTAYLINIGRGRTLDENALIRALENKQIAGAGLDAYATEPLPADSKLWEIPNVVFSPHVSGDGEGIWSIANEQFCENLRRYLTGKKLINIVDKKRGY